MGRALWATIAAGLSLLSTIAVARAAPDYPPTRRDPSVELLHGRTVADPYRWLEADARGDMDVRRWVTAQNAFTRAHLDAIPFRATVKDKLRHVWNFEKLSAPRARNGVQFFEANDGLQNQNVIAARREGGASRVLVDPNKSTAQGSTVVRDWRPSLDGARLLYATQENGGDRRVLRVVDVASGRDTALPLEGIRTPAFAWAADGSGVFYTRYPTGEAGAAAGGSTVFFHKLGTAQAADRQLFADPTGGRLIVWPRPSDDGRWLVIEAGTTDGSRGDIHAIDLADPRATARPLTSGMRASWRFVGVVADRVLLLTTADAPNGRVVSLDLGGSPDQVPTTVAPAGSAPAQQAVLAGDEVVVRALDGLRSRLHRFGLDGRARGEIALPPLTVVGGLEGQPGAPAVFYTLSSLVEAPTLYRTDLSTGRSDVVARPRTGWRAADFEVRQITARSRDGTAIPVTLAYRRMPDRPVPRPTMMLVYGGWGLSVDVGFYESRFAWMELGGVFAIAHIRGGGEFGERWHRAAMKAGHVKGVEDFVAAAETLHRAGITTPRQTVAYGSSNGGMMVAATVNARPDLFGVAMPRVPVTDLVRYTRFTAGRTWIGEIGDPADAKEFAGLMTWSPLHNIANGRHYPAVLVNTAEGDDRVVPMHSFKYVASLQAAGSGATPKLLRVEGAAGHGEGKSTEQLIEEFTDLWAFAAHRTGLRVQ